MNCDSYDDPVHALQTISPLITLQRLQLDYRLFFSLQKGEKSFRHLYRHQRKVELEIIKVNSMNYTTNSDSASPPKSFEDDSRVIRRSPESPHGASPAGFFVPVTDREHPAKSRENWHLCRRAFIVYQRCQALNLLSFAIKITLIKPQSERFA